MKTEDLVVLAWRMVLRNHQRYRTVMIAIALGTLGFIVIRTLGDSVEQKVSDNLELIGGATVLRAEWYDRKYRYHLGEYRHDHVEKLTQIPGLLVVTTVRSTKRDQELLWGRQKRKQSQLTFIDQYFWRTQSAQLAAGRLIDSTDVMQQKRVCVIGRDIMNELFHEGVNPLGEKVSVDGYSYEVVGTLDGIQPDEVSKSIFIPISLADNHISHLRQLVQLFLRVDSYENVESVRDKVEQTLKISNPEYAAGVRVLIYAHRLDRVKFIILVIKLFIYGALVVIFILGKAGLTNIMFSAVQERTREIGLRKAVGASDQMIRAQFILESVLVSLLAGVVGTLGGILFVGVLSGLLELDVSNYVISVSIWIDVSFTVAIGVAAGFYPSLQASRLDIVTAMRFE